MGHLAFPRYNTRVPAHFQAQRPKIGKKARTAPLSALTKPVKGGIVT